MSIKYQIVYWRDIPAQVKVRSGRERFGQVLSQRFQRAIDSVAMRTGVTDTDAYLEEWRTSDWQVMGSGLADGGLAEIAAYLVKEIEADYSLERLQSIMTNKGFQI